jgi:hypothetical protein
MAVTHTIARRKVRIELAPVEFALERLKIALASRTHVAMRGPVRAHLAGAMIRHAPGPDEERDLLVKGTIVMPWSKYLPGTTSRLGRAILHTYGQYMPGGFGQAGTHEGGRFFRQGPQVSLVDALRLQKMKTRKTRLTLGHPRVLVRGVFGNWAHMAKRTSFSYVRKGGAGGKRTRAGTFTTQPFNYDWPRTANYGGTWIVVPRPRGGHRVGVLHPEPGVYARKMVKTVKPYRFAEKGLRDTIKWFSRAITPMVVIPALRAAGFRQRTPST